MGMDSNKKQQMTAKEIAEYIAEEIRSITGGCDAGTHTTQTKHTASRPYTHNSTQPQPTLLSSSRQAVPMCWSRRASRRSAWTPSASWRWDRVWLVDVCFSIPKRALDPLRTYNTRVPHAQLGTRLKKTFGIELDALKLTQDMTVADIAKLVYKLQVKGGTCTICIHSTTRILISSV